MIHKHLIYNRLTILFFLGIIVFGACKTTEESTSYPSLPDIQLADSQELEEPAVYRASKKRDFDLIHTNLDVSFNWADRTMNGTAKISLVPYFLPQRACTLDAKGMDVKNIQLFDSETTLPFFNDGKHLMIDLKKEFSRNDTITIEIEYTAKPYDLKTKEGVAITNSRGLYFVNHDGSNKNKPQQIWTQGEPESNSTWFPTIDAPNERMTQEISITVENKFKTLSNGLLVYSTDNGDGTRTDYWKQDLPAAPYLTMMTVGEFSIVKDTWEGMEVNYYVEPRYEPYAKQIFGNTPEMLTFFSKILGVKYPWEKYSQVVVRDFVTGAMENNTAVVHGEFIQRDANQLLDETNEDFLSHELMHHWFGNLVTTESWSNITLNEAFATYGEYLWNEFKYGKDVADYYGMRDLNAYLRESRSKQVDLIRYNYEEIVNLFDAHSYQKGGRILHYLRYCIGDEAFFKSIEYYLKKHSFQSVEVHDLRLAFEHVTGEDLNWFFNQWFLSSGHPQLEVNYSFDSTANKQIVIIEQVQNLGNTPLYKLPMEVVIITNGKVKKQRIVLEKQKQEFLVATNSKPQMVLVDVGRRIPGTLKDNKTMDDFIYQYKNSPHYLGRVRAIDFIGNNYDENNKEHVQLIFNSSKDKFWHIRFKSIEELQNLVTVDTNKVKSTLAYLALKDKESTIRAEAVYALGQLFPDDEELKPVYETAITDSSYTVLGEGLIYYTALDNKDGLEMARSLADKDISEIRNAVGNIMAEHGEDTDHPFFINGLKNTSGADKHQLVSQYGDYLKKKSPFTIQKGIPYLREVALTASPWWVRIAAMNALTDLSSHVGSKLKDNNLSEDEKIDFEKRKTELNNAIEQIKKEETNPQLIKMYNKS